MNKWLISSVVTVSVILGISVSRGAWMAYSRRHEGFEDYLASFGSCSFPVEVAKAVYDSLRNRAIVKFSVRASDSIENTYGVVAEDLDDVVLSVAKLCKRIAIPTDRKILTVSDLVSVVSSFPRA